jgi:hypothetical protein
VFSLSNGNSFTFGARDSGGCVVGPAVLKGERLVYEDMVARLHEPVAAMSLV